MFVFGGSFVAINYAIPTAVRVSTYVTLRLRTPGAPRLTIQTTGSARSWGRRGAVAFHSVRSVTLTASGSEEGLIWSVSEEPPPDVSAWVARLPTPAGGTLAPHVGVLQRVLRVLASGAPLPNVAPFAIIWQDRFQSSKSNWPLYVVPILPIPAWIIGMLYISRLYRDDHRAQPLD